MEGARRRTPQGMTYMPDDELTKVAFGKCSVFDVYVMSKEDIPFEVPVGSYLEEVLIGLNCSPDLGSHEKKSDVDAEPHMRANYSRLRRVMGTKALRDSCQALFWITVGVIMDRLVPDVIADLRITLARAWSLVALDVHHHMQVHRDQDAEDFLLGALPAILVQTIYRLLVDGFSEDKPQFVHNVDALLEKLSHIVCYEVCGFQLNVETCLKERKQLFRRAVLDSPFVNGRDSAKAQMRQDLLDHRSISPLTFGTSIIEGGQPLEETQLEHVMLHHEEMLRPETIQYANGPALTPVPQKLSVERYVEVAMEGSELFERQLMELLPEEDLPQTPPARKQTVDFKASPLAETERPPSEESWCMSPASPPSSNKSSLRRMKASAKKSMTATRFTSNKRLKEEQQDEKRRRGDLLTKRIVTEPLPPELRARRLNTNWVSPITNRLAPGEGDRQALRKPASEAYHLKMTSPKHLPDLIGSRSRSAPELRVVSRVLELPKLMRSTGGGSDGEGLGASTEWGSPLSSPTATTKSGWSPSQKDVKMTTMFGSSSRALRVAVAEDFILEPPQRLQNNVVMHRLEAAGEMVYANSFGNWVQEFDITSGGKKLRMDGAAVRKAETTYVKSLQDLVGPPGQPALKMFDTPLQMAKRRSEKHKAAIASSSPQRGSCGRRHPTSSSLSLGSD